MRILLDSTAQAVPQSGREKLLIQNLGPGNVYFDTQGSVDPLNGFKLFPGDVYEFEAASADDDVWLVADASSTDVRVVRIG